MRCSGRNDSSAGCDGSKGATAGTCDGPKGWNSSTVRCEGRRLRSRQDLNPEQEHRRCERSLSIQRVRPGLRPPRRKVRLLNRRPGVRGMDALTCPFCNPLADEIVLAKRPLLRPLLTGTPSAPATSSSSPTATSRTSSTRNSPPSSPSSGTQKPSSTNGSTPTATTSGRR